MNTNQLIGLAIIIFAIHTLNYFFGAYSFKKLEEEFIEGDFKILKHCENGYLVEKDGHQFETQIKNYLEIGSSAHLLVWNMSFHQYRRFLLYKKYKLDENGEKNIMRLSTSTITKDKNKK